MSELGDQEQQLIELYKGFEFESNPVCEKCRNQTMDLGRPVGAWIVGKKFAGNNPRVLFVGKVSRGEDGVLCNDFFYPFAYAREEMWNYRAHFWNYTREIVGRVFEDDSIENIAITNLIKCNASDHEDTTCEFTKSQCIANLGVVREEIKCILPTCIVFYTAREYDEYIRNNVFDKDSFCIIKDTTIRNGSRRMPWMEAEATVMGHPVKILRVGHPDRKDKEDFIFSVSSWLKGMPIDEEMW